MRLGLVRARTGTAAPDSLESTVLACLGVQAADRRREPSPLEEEVLALFDQLRDRLLGSGLRFNLLTRPELRGALPEHEQHCLALRAEGLRYRENAEVLGMSLGAVSKSLERSLDRITRGVQR
jgi:DNA-directed RNA polymerase specialized sigma24 family protein